MKVLFVHTATKVIYDNENTIYTGGSYSMEVWNRYINLTDENKITFIARKEDKIYDSDIAKKQFSFLDKEKIEVVPVDNRLSSLKSLINFKKFKEIKAKIEDNVKRADFVIIRLPCEEGYIALDYVRKYNKKHVVEVVGCPFNAYWYHSLKGKIVAPLNYLKMRMAIRKSKNTLYVCEYLHKKYPCRDRYIICSDVQLKDMNNEILDRRIKENKCECINIGLMGSYDVNYKGHKMALKIIKELKSKLKCKIYFIGPGKKDRWESLAKKLDVNDYVCFGGNLPSGEVNSWLDNIDVLLNLSETEGLSRAVLEAMSRGCACICTNVGGTKEIISNKYLVKVGDYKKAALLLKELVENKDERKETMIRNFNIAKQYTQNILDEKRNKFYNDSKND